MGHALCTDALTEAVETPNTNSNSNTNEQARVLTDLTDLEELVVDVVEDSVGALLVKTLRKKLQSTRSYPPWRSSYSKTEPWTCVCGRYRDGYVYFSVVLR